MQLRFRGREPLGDTASCVYMHEKRIGPHRRLAYETPGRVVALVDWSGFGGMGERAFSLAVVLRSLAYQTFSFFRLFFHSAFLSEMHRRWCVIVGMVWCGRIAYVWVQQRVGQLLWLRKPGLFSAEKCSPTGRISYKHEPRTRNASRHQLYLRIYTQST